MPSTARAEQFGLVQLEAMHCAKPVVATRLGTGVEYVTLDEVTGLLVEPNDEAALAQALNRLLGDSALSQRLGAAGRVRVEQEFSVRADGGKDRGAIPAAGGGRVRRCAWSIIAPMPQALPLTYLAQAAAAAFIAGLLILMLRRPAERWGLVDHPGGRKRHAAPVPLTGGSRGDGGPGARARILVRGISAVQRVFFRCLAARRRRPARRSWRGFARHQAAAAGDRRVADDVLGRELPRQPRRPVRHQPDQYAPLGDPDHRAGHAGGRQRDQHARRARWPGGKPGARHRCWC